MLFDFEALKIRGLSIKSFEMRELTGVDSEAAAARVVQNNMTQVHGFMLSRAHTEHCIADAITHVNGSPVINPYIDWIKWNLRTREYVINVYNKMNGATQQEMDDFFVRVGLVDRESEPAKSGQ